ncbi:MAG: glutamine--tRNA ligase/YqeY domain fusion protein [Spirochaetales bacterium]|jgi:glutaminyl-tRNA synthetase|nr:glutamine--tRNA ligase/YqeY domain fusion protein [Spirochaetales bacterium]
MAENISQAASSDFIREFINEDIKNGKVSGKITTRFPPEPNGYLHIGHAKAICIDFGIARDYGGVCNLRMDDTNPSKEDVEYIDAIQEDIRWLGFTWDNMFYASDYFEQLYQWAEFLIQKGLAYVDDSSAEEISRMRGAPSEPGKLSPWRTRAPEENLDLFRRMRAGGFPDGSKVLRAKIDMSSPNLNMRDPVMYRIRRETHHRTGDAWCIYPMYDYAHGQSDAIEGITHSLCSLEFENHRPLYDWFTAALELKHRPRQIEFARLNLTYTMMSKRRLLELVQKNIVDGWDDPRMPTISGLRRRGYTPEAIRAFAERIGVAKVNSMIDLAFLEFCLREDLNKRARRVMAVLDPLRLTITNYPDAQVEEFDADNNPEDPAAGTRKIPFSKTLYIEREDFAEVPPKGFFRLSPGKEIRLKHAYYITCSGLTKNAAGEITEILCTYDPESRGGATPDGRKVKGTSHWVSAAHAAEAEVRLYDNIFTLADPSDVPEGKNWEDFINPGSLKILSGCKVEPGLKDAKPGETFQFLRQGYFCADSKFAGQGRLVFNRTVTLKDTWARLQNKTTSGR